MKKYEKLITTWANNTSSVPVLTAKQFDAVRALIKYMAMKCGPVKFAKLMALDLFLVTRDQNTSKEI